MALSPITHKRRLVLWAAAAMFAAGLLYFAPLFRVVSLRAAREQSASVVFDAAAFAETFWSERLLKSADQAVDVVALCAALQDDPRATRVRYGRSLGLSDTYYYFVSGAGQVARLPGNAVAIALGDPGGTPEIVIDTGPVFGNALRDGTGLLNVSDFPNSQDFNAISSEINRRVEERVLPALRQQAAVGVRVRFVGCVEIANEDTDLDPLRVVPLIAEVEP